MSKNNIAVIVISLIVIIAGGLLIFSTQRDSTDDNNTTTNSSEVREEEKSSDKTNVSLEIIENDQMNDSADQTSTPVDEPISNVAVDDFQFADGDYSEELRYVVPRGFNEDIIVELSLKDDLVESLSVSFGPVSNPQTEVHQSNFNENFDESEFIGKNLEEVVQSRISGASLSTKAFNDAISNIQSRASN